jgi:hypothetical protein
VVPGNSLRAYSQRAERIPAESATEPLMPRICRNLSSLPLFAGLLVGVASLAPAPVAAAPDNGYSTVIEPQFTGEELRYQQDLWAVEVAVKPMRMVYVQVRNPKTGEKSSEMIWYLVYKIVNRPVAHLGTPDTDPVTADFLAESDAGLQRPRFARSRRRFDRAGGDAGDSCPRRSRLEDGRPD